MRLSPTLALVFLTAVSAPVAAQDISTLTPDSTYYRAGLFGGTNGWTFGQTFTVGANTHLDSFSFWLTNYNNAQDMLFSAFVMGWNGTHATTTLWSNDGYVGPDGPSRSWQQISGSGDAGRYDFFTGSLALTEGEQYVAFLSPADHFAPEAALLGRVDNSTYGGGNFVRVQDYGDEGVRTSTTWYMLPDNYDLAFEAEFSAAPGEVVPEPTTWVLLGTGLLAIGGVAVLRRREQQGLTESA